MRNFILLLSVALSILSCSPEKDVSTKTYKGVELYKGATEFQYVRNDTIHTDNFDKAGFYSSAYTLDDKGASSAVAVDKTIIYQNYNTSNYDYAVYYLSSSLSRVVVLAHSAKTDDYFIGRFPSDEKCLYTPSINGGDGYTLTTRIR